MHPFVPGIHHVTAISGAPQRNVDFYIGFLGLRLVKKTVNFDDPGTYHLYYGDALGYPGTILTFFPWPDAMRGRTGAGMARATAFAIPEASFDFWMERFADVAYDFDVPGERFGERVLAFDDPDGIRLELVAHAGAERFDGWSDGPVPADHAVRGFHSVTLGVGVPEHTARVLTEVLGYESGGQEGDRLRFRAPAPDRADRIDLVRSNALARMGAGTVHHVAFRARSEDEQLEWRERAASFGLQVTPVLDRNYFRSVYFREPNGVLFEIATDPPGFTIDETPDELGTSLKLPTWLEPRRARIEGRLLDLAVPYPLKTRTVP